LAAALRDRHVEVWYDEFSLKVGDSLRAKIDEGLSQSDFGVVIVSPAFFKKRDALCASAEILAPR
jgi:hypothetical protein